MAFNLNLRLGKYIRFLKIVCLLAATKFIASKLFPRKTFVKQSLLFKEQVLISNHSNMTDIGKWVIPNRNMHNLERCELHWDCSPGKHISFVFILSPIIFELLLVWVLIDNKQ